MASREKLFAVQVVAGLKVKHSKKEHPWPGIPFFNSAPMFKRAKTP